MRINVHSQDLTKEVAGVYKRTDGGQVYCGVRIYLEGAPPLHRHADADDKSAITYWLPNCGDITADDLADVFRRAADMVESLALSMQRA